MSQIILNNKEYIATENELPSFITYGEQSGGSYFTVTFLASLFKSGSKILFFTAFTNAKDNFLEQVGPGNPKVSIVNSIEDLNKHKDSQVIILESGNQDLFMESIRLLEDIKERVVLVKNIEEFGLGVIKSSLALQKVILSGNLDKCKTKDEIFTKHFKSMVIFTKPQTSIPVDIPKLEKYTGYFMNENIRGLIKVVI